MSFREKYAWISLIATALFAVYWLQTVRGMSAIQRLQPGEMAGVMIGAVLLVIFVSIGLGVAAAIATPKDEVDAPADERERQIEARSLQAPYYIFVAGVITVAGAMAFGASTFSAINGLVGTLVAAELVCYATQIYLFRRGI